MLCTFLIVSMNENVILKHQQINLIAGQHCQYFNVKQPKYAIPDIKLIDTLEVRQIPYLNDLQLEK